MTDDRRRRFPVGASLTLDELRTDPYDALAELRRVEPVSWVPALNGWLITRRDLAAETMRDADTFTVDDPRFSTAAVLGQSMLSLDGPEHERHRRAFAEHFRRDAVHRDFDAAVRAEARRLVGRMGSSGSGELRTQLAGPLAVNTISTFLGLGSVDPEAVAGWYGLISDAIVGVSIGEPVSVAAERAIAEIHDGVSTVLDTPGRSVLHEIAAAGLLRPDEIAPAVAVVMFGAIETSEGMTANALWHLLGHPEALAEIRADRSLIAPAIEESLRLEPAAAVIDRYAARTVDVGPTTIDAGDLVIVSLLGANRDPEVFADPDRFDIHRADLGHHVTFVQGPHGCLGLHLARVETQAAVAAVLELLPEIELDHRASSPPEGLIFRKPRAVQVRWSR